MAVSCVDPVCKCELEQESKYSTEYEGKKIYFCSVQCKGKFDKNPIDYMAEYLRTGA